MASSSSLSSATGPPVGVLDPEGYAICPDCGTKINCGKVGLANLENRHRRTKTCREAAQKRDRDMKQRKNGSLLTFLQKRPTPVPTTVMPAQLITSASLGSCGTRNLIENQDPQSQNSLEPEASIVRDLRELIAQLPTTVPEASSSDEIAIFGSDPKSFDDPQKLSEDLWETMMNPTLKSVFGWGEEKDLRTVIRRGQSGMDGFLAFVKYFVDVRRVPASLVEGKLSRLIETLKVL
ncbi:hypothetical protein H0H93_012839 [Arthromyces matolae]|nr:hypothetical protein H0H93_012839 [Arthromyces matolae]